MHKFRQALLLLATTFVLGPAASFAQVPDSVQSSLPQPIVGRSQTLAQKEQEEERTREIESTRSDIADLSRFDHGNEYLPKAFYKRNYVAPDVKAELVAGKTVSSHRM